MSASVKMLSSKLLRQFFRLCNANNHARGLKRNPIAVYSTDEERQLLKERKIRQDPKKNPYVNYEISDPVQKNLVGLARQKRKPSVLKSPTKSHDPRRQQSDQGGHINCPDYGSIAGRKTTPTPQSYVKLTDSDKRFG